jgi:ribosomal RNA-processing protein 9
MEKRTKKRRKIDKDENLDIYSDLESEDKHSANEEDEEIEETADEKRIRMAKEYLRRVQKAEIQEDRLEFEAGDLDKEIIAARLKQDAVSECITQLTTKII